MPALGTGTPAEVRFWRHVNKESDQGCWLWTAAVVMKYGRFSSDEIVIQAGRRKQRPVKAHRYSWILAHGPIPDGLHVCHTCDVPLCVNPAHLFLGTVLDNKADQIRKRRNPILSGEKNGNALLTEAQVKEILARGRYAIARVVAAEYGVGIQAIYDIWARRTWKYLDAA